jgi:GNAT superfamily N-acetyltransferase
MGLGETVSQISSSDGRLAFPKGLSFFDPHLQHYVNEVLAIGGEAYISKSGDGEISGLFIYDDSEKSGTIFTRSREIFDYFYELKQFDTLFAEMKTEHKSEEYDIYSIDLEKSSIDCKFSNEITIVGQEQRDEIRQFMELTHPGTNKNWVNVSLDNGDQCFTVRLQDEIAGLGWASNNNGVGRLHSLFVKPQFRGLGIGRDIVYARLLWLRSKGVRSAFSEISRENRASTRIAMNAQMRVSGHVFQYFRRDPVRTVEHGPMTV